ncbi:MAG: tetratricopeptide repeat protein [Pseudomonadota bacterium]
MVAPIEIPDDAYVSETSSSVAAILESDYPEGDEKIIRDLERLADKGDDSALELLGEAFAFGVLGAERDPVRACDYFARLDGRRPDGLHNMANCFEFGAGRPKDLAKARALYRSAAQAGWRQSICAYGNMLIKGEGGPEDQAEGLRLCQLSAVAGDANAQTDYDGYLLMGIGTERDPMTARFMFEQAVVEKQRNAAFLLAQIHQKGDGVPANEEEARKWFEHAYEWGRPDAAFQVGLIYARRGYIEEEHKTYLRPDDLEKARDWFAVTIESDPNPDTRETAQGLSDNLQVLIESAAQQ